MKEVQKTAIVPITESTAELIRQPTKKRDNLRNRQNRIPPKSFRDPLQVSPPKNAPVVEAIPSQHMTACPDTRPLGIQSSPQPPNESARLPFYESFP